MTETELLKIALNQRIPLVTDKDMALEVLKGHVQGGRLTNAEAQVFVDMLYPIEYVETLDDEGEVVSREAITEQVVIEEPVPNPNLTDAERIDRLELLLLQIEGVINE